MGLVKWPEEIEIEGKGEIYLRWKNLAIIALVIILPLIFSLFFDSLIIKAFCWGFCFLSYMSYLRVQGPCVTAIIVGALPWYIFFEWETLPRWLVVIAAIISLIEISYIRSRMRRIGQLRRIPGTVYLIMGNSALKHEKQAQYKKVLAKRVVIVYEPI